MVTVMCYVSQGQREESGVDEALAAKEAQELYDVCVVCVCIVYACVRICTA